MIGMVCKLVGKASVEIVHGGFPAQCSNAICFMTLGRSVPALDVPVSRDLI